jgi:hypothetical protein
MPGRKGFMQRRGDMQKNEKGGFAHRGICTRRRRGAQKGGVAHRYRERKSLPADIAEYAEERICTLRRRGRKEPVLYLRILRYLRDIFLIALDRCL